MMGDFAGGDDPAALRAIREQAEAETRELRHGYIGSEHLLLALLGAVGSRAAQRLGAAGGRYEEVRARIVEVVGAGERRARTSRSCRTPNAVAVVRWVGKEAERVRPEAIGTEHVLRAALRRRDSLAVRVLEDCAVDASGLANKLKRARPHDEFRDGALADAVLTIQLDRSSGHDPRTD